MKKPTDAIYESKCWGYGDIGNGVWLPYFREGKNYYTPQGLKAHPPLAWRPDDQSRERGPIDENDSMGFGLKDETR